MNVFCLVLGHTWVPYSDNPKTAWNVDDTGQVLVARQSAQPRFFEECARCRERREARPTQSPNAG